MAPGPLPVGCRGILVCGLEPIPAPIRPSTEHISRSSGVRLSSGCAMEWERGPFGHNLSSRSGGSSGFVRLEHGCWVMMCPVPAGRPGFAGCSRSPPWGQYGTVDTSAAIARSAPRTDRGSRRADPPVRVATSRAVPGNVGVCARDGSCRGTRNHPPLPFHRLRRRNLGQLRPACRSSPAAAAP